MQVKTQQDLVRFLKQLQQPVSKALNSNVAQTIKTVMKDKVQDEVYDPYTPSVYQRTGRLGSEDSMESKLINDDTLIVENVRSDGDRNVAEIVETGKGYTYDFQYSGIPRPFTEATREELRNTGAHVAALYAGLKQQNIKVDKK
ncbi:hypothetical protein MKY95_10165 [Paenibacillus sp. FSL P4-0176]|uniref:hypothetical protein n=1 Tax=Paenibacillus sp. FSL P4-0176 TaxID=2921631 RepID=UPI0030CF5EDA